MPKIKILLLDADGVIIRPPKLFSEYFTARHGLSADLVKQFFETDFQDASVGKADLAELIRSRHDVWRWDADPKDLIEQWFEYEHHLDADMMKLIHQCRTEEMGVYLATVQEAYRAKYLREVTFPDVFDGMFISCEIGYIKQDPGFWEVVLKTLGERNPGVQADEIAFFDDHEGAVAGAQAAGIKGYLFKDAARVRSLVGLKH